MYFFVYHLKEKNFEVWTFKNLFNFNWMCIENFKHKKNNSVAQKTGRNAGCFMEMKKSQKLCSLL